MCSTKNTSDAAECVSCGRNFSNPRKSKREKTLLGKIIVWLIIAFNLWIAAELVLLVAGNWEMLNGNNPFARGEVWGAITGLGIKWFIGLCILAGIGGFEESHAKKKAARKAADQSTA